MLITLSDGTRIDVPMTGDVEGGRDYDIGGALNARGYLELKDPGLDWFRQTGQGNFANPTDYFKWVYGGGDVVSGPNGQQYFRTPNGLANVVNQPLNYNEQEFADSAWMIPLGIAGAGLFAGAAGAGAGAGEFGGFTAGAGAEGIGSIGAGEGAFSGATASGLGGGMEGFFDDILSEVVDFGGDEVIDIDGWFNDQLTNFDDALGSSGTDWWRKLTQSAGDLFGGNGNGNIFGADSFLGDLFSTGLSVAPSIAAIEYAKNTAPFDTSRLKNIYANADFSTKGVPGIKRLQNLYRSFDPEENAASTGRLRRLYNEFDPDASSERLRGLYEEYNPEALARTYDINTGTGRERLTSNLARRQLSGSSFGNADILNYDTSRDLGRQQLINQGAGLRADIARGIGDLDLRGTGMQYDIGKGIADVDLRNAALYNQGVGMQYDIARGISDVNLRDQALDLQGVKTQADIANDITKFQALDRQYKNQLYSAALLALSGGLRR